MTQLGAIELTVHWACPLDTTLGPVRNPNLEVIAIPLDIEDGNALYVKGRSIEIQVKNKYVNDTDLKYAIMGNCTGYLTVYPGYTEKKQQPNLQFAKTYTLEWCNVYVVDAERSSFLISARGTETLGEDITFFWGRFG